VVDRRIALRPVGPPDDGEAHRDGFRSRREYGDYSAFVGENRDEVIQRALRAREDWGREVYRVLVGVLDSEAREPVRFEVVPLAGATTEAAR
jgi:hypothetical protein